MPRIARVLGGGLVHHVINRGHGQTKLFRKPADYDAFVNLLGEALQQVAGMRLLAYCIMPTHWHLALWPRKDKDLPAFMRWMSNTHVRRWRHQSHPVREGNVYQGRYKNFLVQNDEHYLTLRRYIEANPVRARRVPRAEQWRWSSLSMATSPAGQPLLSDGPVDRPTRWISRVNEPLSEQLLQEVRASVQRGRPLGDERWTQRTAQRLGLGFTLRPRGRPRKTPSVA